ncbi:glycosyltransferase family 1 protein [Palleniella muris]|uniref:Glycosyltransferase family 1 protein n=1 Tax=Palleniella muris TaxID=3038145 RepID=A0AC61QNW1_9BACT|nr:glycosyltransferase [Palleniella muris]TGX81465.1 glycosyltransferase family 1 protein [Palleniella muris]
MTLHVICLDQPYPPTYGGAVDMYYKLKALHDAGIGLILHIFLYHGKEEDALRGIAKEIHYYPRRTGLIRQLSLLPFSIRSRDDSRLLDDLLKDSHPILFEGIQSCFPLADKRLKDRKKIVRMHNVEHEYFRRFAASCPWGMKRFYYTMEALKLRHFERILAHADRILPITEADTAYYRQRFPHNDVRLLNCFFDTSHDNSAGNIGGEEKPYILYHGNLSIIENIKTVHYLISDIAPHLPEGMRLIIAGRRPSGKMMHTAEHTNHVEIIHDPSEEKMDSLISKAHINLLLTFQPTGIKLKLLNSLWKGQGHCLVNSPMLHGNSLGTLCHKADSTEDILTTITALMKRQPSSEELKARREAIMEMGFNNIRNIIE